MSFLKITKVQADLIGVFEYKENHFFDPYIKEQKDGSYLVATEVYEELKDTVQFKEIDWSGVTTTNTTNDKVIPILTPR
jgi:hypothetical protein